jgi:Tfp pilus assembly protein PilX
MQALNRPLKNQRGSMIAVVIMILALLTHRVGNCEQRADL